jgi:PKD repeat protein
MRWNVAWMAVACAVAMLAGCGSWNTAAERGLAPANEGIIPFPDNRSSSALTEAVLAGRNTEARSAGASAVGSTLLLPASPGTPQYALYRLNLGSHHPDSVAVMLEQAVGDGAFVGLPDFDTGRWQFSGPYKQSKTLAVDAHQFISPSGNLWVAVLTAPGGGAVVHALSVRMISPGNQPPMASGEADKLSGNAPLTVNFDAGQSTDDDGSIIEYAWDWDGDGLYDGITETASAKHTFLNPGQYKVKLRVTDDQFGHGFLSFDIDVTAQNNQAPLAIYTCDPPSGSVPLSVFFDAGNSFDPDGQIVRFDWDFDGDLAWDGYDSEQAIRHVYATPGLYSTHLRITDDKCVQRIETHTVSVNVAGNALPVAAFDPSAENGDAPLSVTFDASDALDSDGSITRYDWDFDNDGIWDAYDSGSLVNHTYGLPGLYSAALRVTDNAGGQARASVDISINAVGNQLPTVNFSATPSSGKAPLVVAFDAGSSTDPDGTLVRYDWDFDNDGIWDAYDAGKTISRMYALAGGYTAKLRVTDNAGGQASKTVAITVNTSTAPTAKFTESSPAGKAPLSVTFDAGTSTSPNGAITKFEWDWDGDGTYDAYSASPAAGHSFAVNGSWTIRLRVTDAVGATATVVHQVCVTDWNYVRLPLQTIFTLMPIGGVPCICSGNGPLQFTRAIDADGAGWNNPQTISESYYQFGQMAIIDGAPATAFTNGLAVGYIHSLDASGSAWSDPVYVDFLHGSQVDDCSLAEVDGTPAISFGIGATGRLGYIRAADAAGTTWNDLVWVDPNTSHRGENTSLLVVDGFPAIGYYDVSTHDLKFVRALDNDGITWGMPVDVDTANLTGAYASMQIVAGNPALAYYYVTGKDLRFVRALDNDGTSWGTPLTLDSTGDVGWFPALGVVSGKPVISYYDNTNDDLRFIAASNADGSSWNSPETLDADGTPGIYSSVAEVNGHAAIAYSPNGVSYLWKP